MTTHITKTLALVAMSACLAGPAIAQDRQSQEREIVVQPPAVTYAQTVGEELNDALYDVAYPGNMSGVVRVQFIASPDGVAEHARIVESSGSNRVDRAAMRAIARLNDLGPTPGSGYESQPVLATIVYATTRSELRDMTRDLDSGYDRLVASGAVSADTLAITLLPDDHGG